jgi:hypothetical protein
MRIGSRRRASWWIAACGAVLLSVVPPLNAQEKASAAGQEKKMQVEDQDTIAAVLKRLEGRPVKLRLAGSGDEIAGKVAKVGKDLVVLTELSGREFYDAAIRIDQVSAVVVQVRGGR